MNRKPIVFAFVCLVACRGVVGVHDLELDDGGATTAKDAGDGSVPPVQPPPPGQPPTPKGDAGQCKNSTQPPCIKCCRDANPTANQKYDEAIKTCTCQSCGPSSCGNYCTTGAIDTSNCGPCQDQSIHDAGCWPSLDTCIKDPTCHPLGDCIAGCLE